MAHAPHFLVLDAYDREGREALRRAGASAAGDLYERMLKRLSSGARVTILHPADTETQLPSGVALGDFDGVAWTGSSLTIHHHEDPRVRRQVELVRAVFSAGVPSFGSCWAAQLAAVAIGGTCAASPKGREFGIARKIVLSEAGAAHPLFRNKARVFDALASHADEVTSLPAGGENLAGNAFSPVQALCVQHGRGSFWAVQYHPEYDLHEVARLCVLRTDELVAQGCFHDAAAAAAYVSQLESLHRDPSRSDIAWWLGIDAEILDEECRQREVRNWIEAQVMPRVGATA